LEEYNFNQHKYMLGVYSHLVVIIVGSVASLFWPKPDINKNLLFSGWLEAKRAGK
jgi:SSS family solute:Na+ symporter